MALTADSNQRRLQAMVAIELTHLEVQSEFLESDDFCKEFGIVRDGLVSFDEIGVTFQRSKLFPIVRAYSSNDQPASVCDSQGGEWLVDRQDTDQPQFILSDGTRRLELEHVALISENSAERIASLSHAAATMGLPDESEGEWAQTINERPLTDEEFQSFCDDLVDTPESFENRLRKLFRAKSARVSAAALVPSSQRYYERLVGAYDNSSSIGEYADGLKKTGSPIRFDTPDVKRIAKQLVMCSHAVLTELVSLAGLTGQEISDLLDWLIESGDRNSQVAMVELLLREAEHTDSHTDKVANLVEQIRDDSSDADGSRTVLHQAVFMLVDSELSRRRLFFAAPPFYRRLASQAHAGLLTRVLLSSGVNASKFAEWAIRSCAERFYIQSWIDMRREPRWEPDASSDIQMRQEFIGRILNAAELHKESIQDNRLHSLMRSDEPRSLKAQSQFPLPFYPGPLEGGAEVAVEAPKEITTTVVEQLSELSDGTATRDTFIALINAARLFRSNESHAEIASEILKRSKFRIRSIADKGDVSFLLNGLAMVAASARSRPLAEGVRIMTRRHMAEGQFPISPDEALSIAFKSAAFAKEFDDWSDFLGDWITELSYADLSRQEAEGMLSHVEVACAVEPDLLIVCGRALAALRSIAR